MDTREVNEKSLKEHLFNSEDGIFANYYGSEVGKKILHSFTRNTDSINAIQRLITPFFERDRIFSLLSMKKVHGGMDAYVADIMSFSGDVPVTKDHIGPDSFNEGIVQGSFAFGCADITFRILRTEIEKYNYRYSFAEGQIPSLELEKIRLRSESVIKKLEKICYEGDSKVGIRGLYNLATSSLSTANDSGRLEGLMESTRSKVKKSWSEKSLQEKLDDIKRGKEYLVKVGGMDNYPDTLLIDHESYSDLTHRLVSVGSPTEILSKFGVSIYPSWYLNKGKFSDGAFILLNRRSLEFVYADMLRQEQPLPITGGTTYYYLTKVAGPVPLRTSPLYIGMNTIST